jgi:hypothetical protein
VGKVRDREALLEVWQAVGTGAALLTVAWAAVELVIGVDLFGIIVFAVLASIAIAAVLMIFAIQSGWWRAYRGKRSGEGSASKDAKQSDEQKRPKNRVNAAAQRRR